MKKFAYLSIFTFSASIVVHLLSYFSALQLKIAYVFWLHLLTMVSFGSVFVCIIYVSFGKVKLIETNKKPKWIGILFLISLSYFFSFIILSDDPKYLRGELVNNKIDGKVQYYHILYNGKKTEFDEKEYWNIHARNLRFFSAYWSFFSFLSVLFYYGVVPTVKIQRANQVL